MSAIIIFVILMFLIAIVLVVAAQKLKVEGNPLVDKINEILPQTQCGQCDYIGCKPYAQAIACGDAAINKCPPGGQEGVDALADLLGVETLELSAENKTSEQKTVALIDENDCIGCTLCIKACPVDAIVGASKLMTTVIVDECTGCELCIPPCPVDCIEMIEIKPTIDNFVPTIELVNES